MRYFCGMTTDLNTDWKDLMVQLEARFGEALELDGILFLIGLQELGKGYQRYNKDQKMDVLHIAVCTLLEPYGYYQSTGRDAAGWPHWERNQKLPPLKGAEQEKLMKEAIVGYFRTR